MLLEAVKRFRGFNGDLDCWGERGEHEGLGIVSLVGMLPPAAVTSLQHSFPQNWNNRDPHHSPHLLLTLSHTFPPDFSSWPDSRNKPQYLLISKRDIPYTLCRGEQQTQQSSFFIALTDFTHCSPLS